MSYAHIFKKGSDVSLCGYQFSMHNSTSDGVGDESEPCSTCYERADFKIKTSGLMRYYMKNPSKIPVQHIPISPK